MRMPTLETPRLRIRELTGADLAAVHALLDAFEPRALAARRRWLEWSVLNYEQLAELKQPPFGDRAIELLDTAEFVGLCGLVPCLGPYGPLLGEPLSDRAVPEVGLYWTVSPEHRRHGYATEAGSALIAYAFDELRVRRVIATTTYDNAASMGVMRRLGMTLHPNPDSTPEWLQIVAVLAATS
jgi:RimJ/RimL family protein N-acetyltransferase